MPYSRKVETLLNRKDVRVGDRILLRSGPRSYEGLLMPKTGAGDPDSIVIKLDSGYNIGLKLDAKLSLSKSPSKEPDSVEEEEEFELGRISEKLIKLKFDPKKPPVSLVAAGGTIASRVDYMTGGVNMQMDPREFLHNVPELAGIVNLKNVSNPFNMASEDMNHVHWQEIARDVARRLNSGDRGVIVTHGTDFLHYTAAALSFFLRNLTKPVILVGAQRSTDRGSSDGGMNLICASHVAKGEIAEVGICMHGRPDDDYCLFTRGTHVRKMDTQRRDAFRPINEYPLAQVWPDGRIKIKNHNHKKRNDRQKVRLDTKFEPKVAILKAYPGSDPSIIDYLVSKRYRGFVIEAGGLGHVPTNGKGSWIPTISKHVKKGIPFITTPQTIYGRINPNVYSNLRVLYKETGAIPGGDMLTEVAYVKLGWVLGHTRNPEKVREMMLTDYAGEITGRSLAGTFLY